MDRYIGKCAPGDTQPRLEMPLMIHTDESCVVSMYHDTLAHIKHIGICKLVFVKLTSSIFVMVKVIIMIERRRRVCD